MIVGLLPRVRYVIFTDRILEELPPDELDAVFGHEVGHAKHGHIWLYAVFLAAEHDGAGGGAACCWASSRLSPAGVVPRRGSRTGWRPCRRWRAWPRTCSWCSGSCRGGASGRRTCTGAGRCRAPTRTARGHDEATAYPERAGGLCPTGIRTFVHALERVGYVNGHGGRRPAQGPPSLGVLASGCSAWLRAWQHSTLPRRVGVPAVADRATRPASGGSSGR